ncbi:MAG: TolC family protein, partial [Flavobacteriaceae bacterium]|nr:TolC family protein [Flavobacteriaceae bacterium]
MKNRYRFIALFWIASTVGVFAQQLDELIETALENNARLNVLELKVAATKEGEIQAESWKNTSISSALFISEPETRTGPQKFQLSASQPIPAFGRITARTAYAKSLTDISYQEWVIAKRKLILEVAQLYYNYQVLIRQSALIEKHIKRLDQYISIATTKVTTGEASAVDV